VTRTTIGDLSRTALIALLLPGAAGALDNGALEDVLVTGAYAPQQALTSSVSIIDSEQLRALNKRSLAGILKTLPGLLVEEQGGPGGLTAVSVRGGEANFTLVLLDGVAVNDPTNFRGGSFDLADLNPALIDRIEVVRGPQSAIYGSDALAGVINIITRRPREGHALEASAEFGEDDYSDLGVAAFGSTGSFDYTLELASRDEGEPVPGSERDSDSALLRLGWRPAAGHELAASYRYLDGDRTSYPEQSGGPEYALSDALEKGDYDEQVYALGWSWRVTPAWRSSLRASRFDRDEDYLSPGIPPFFEVPPNAADTQYTRDDIQWVNTLALADNYELSLGADYRDEDGESVGYVEFFGMRGATDFELDRDSTGLFASLRATPLADLLLQGSVRHDDPDAFSGETSWQAGASYLVGPLTLSANWGEAYKLPSFFALGNALVGNPDLQPETAESWDAGVAWDVRGDLRLEATWFHNDFEDLVDFDDETFRNVNRQNVQTSGLEMLATWRPLDALSLIAQGTYTDIDVKGEDTVLTGRPEWTAGAAVEWRFAMRWQTALDYRYTGEQWAASRHTGQEVTEELDAYHRVDWVLQWAPARHWQLRLSVDNLLDEDYETAVGFFAPGRALRAGVRFTH